MRHSTVNTYVSRSKRMFSFGARHACNRSIRGMKCTRGRGKKVDKLIDILMIYPTREEEWFFERIKQREKKMEILYIFILYVYCVYYIYLFLFFFFKQHICTIYIHIYDRMILHCDKFDSLFKNILFFSI